MPHYLQYGLYHNWYLPPPLVPGDDLLVLTPTSSFLVIRILPYWILKYTNLSKARGEGWGLALGCKKRTMVLYLE